MSVRSMVKDAPLGDAPQDRYISLGGGPVLYRESEADVYQSQTGAIRQYATGKRHADSVTGMQPKAQTRKLMDLAVQSARKGGLNDAVVAAQLTAFSGVDVTPRMVRNWRQRYP